MNDFAIDLSENVEINGSVQNIRIRTRSLAYPAMLFIHGGPGVTDRHLVLRSCAGLYDCCTIVCWDQRGCGKSFTKVSLGESFDIDTFVEDARQVVEYACMRLGKQKVYVVGHSWGSIVGVMLAQRHPEHVAAYIGMGQFCEGVENERLSYEFVLSEAERLGDRRAMRRLRGIGAPVEGRYRSERDMRVQRDYLTRYGGGCWKKREGIYKSIILPLMRTPEYRLSELPGMIKGTLHSQEQLVDAVVALNFFRDVPELAVPVIMTEGVHDQNTPASIARRWFDALKAPEKHWLWFEDSAHSPLHEEPEKWCREVRKALNI